jgi:HK97 family phage prohead protease
MRPNLTNRLEIKDFDDESGKVVFYYSAFNNTDLGGDVVFPSAFKKTVKENFKHIYHNRDHNEAVGAPIEFGQDEKGAYVVSQLGIKTMDGRDCYEQYKAGIIKGHSMEYEAIKWNNDQSSGTRELKECKLWGVTSVTNIPMNLNATTISVKSASQLIYQMEEIERFLRNGNISDKCAQDFLNKYDGLSVLVKSLRESAGITADEVEPVEVKAAIDYQFLNQNVKFL